jgi:predicted dehydrogenase
MPDGAAESPRSLGVGVIGTGTIARAHIQALRIVDRVFWPARVAPRLEMVASRSSQRAEEAAARWGFEAWTDDWRELVAAETVQLVVNATPNDLHARPSIAGLECGVAVLCEKPLARTSEEAGDMWRVARSSRSVHATGFNYRFVPALRLAWHLIRDGRLGEIHHFRGVYLKGSGPNTDAPLKWRHRREIAGLGTSADLGSHLIDLARWLVGEIATVSGLTRTFVPDRLVPGGGREPVTVDDAASVLLEFGNGAMGTLDTTRFAPGHANNLSLEVNGSRGSLRFSLERLNELEVFLDGDPPELSGFRSVLVTEAEHPFYRYWWSPGHVIGWEHSFIHQTQHVLLATAGLGSIAPEGATFEDGYRAAVVADAIAESAVSGRRVDLDWKE